MAGVALGDVDALMANDDFSPAATFSLEGLGSCPRGEAGRFVDDAFERAIYCDLAASKGGVTGSALHAIARREIGRGRHRPRAKAGSSNGAPSIVR